MRTFTRPEGNKYWNSVLRSHSLFLISSSQAVHILYFPTFLAKPTRLPYSDAITMRQLSHLGILRQHLEHSQIRAKEVWKGLPHIAHFLDIVGIYRASSRIRFCASFARRRILSTSFRGTPSSSSRSAISRTLSTSSSVFTLIIS